MMKLLTLPARFFFGVFTVLACLFFTALLAEMSGLVVLAVLEVVKKL